MQPHAPRRRFARRVQFFVVAAALAGLGGASAAGLSAAARSAVSTSTFAPTDDTYASAENPTTIHGALTYLRIDGTPVRATYLRFDVAGVDGSVTRATLRLYGAEDGPGGDVRPVTGGDWSEGSLTFRSAPALGSSAASFGAVTSGAWTAVDVSSLVRGNGVVSLALTTASSEGFRFASKEAGAATAPQLVVESSGGPTTTSTTTTTTTSTTITTTAPTTTAAPPPDGNISFPARGAFYYPWYPETWKVGGVLPHAAPSLGYYNSSDAGVVDAQIRALDYARVNVAIASWWGPGTHSESVRIPLLLARTRALGSPLRWALYDEREGISDPTVDQLRADLAYAAAHYASSPAYAHVGGKPVIFVYNANDRTCSVADRWKQAAGSDWYVVLKVFPGYRTCASRPGGWHQYAPSAAEDSQSGYSFSISPGFWKANEASPRLTRDTTRFAQNVHDMIASKAPWQLVTTFNEWGEGTEVESSTSWTNAFLDVLHGTAPPPPPPPPSPPPAAGPCGTAASAPATWKHVIWIWMENHSSTQIIGSSAAPYLNQLANECGLATNYHGVAHPSLPNYIAATSGGTQGITDDNPPSSHPLAVASIFSQVTSWRSYEESMPSNCALTSSGTYAVKHNPAAYYTGIRAQCASWDVPFTVFATDLQNDALPAFSFVTPNLCNDMHDCSVATGDAWLKTWVPQILASPGYTSGNTVLVITFDEDDGSSSNLVPAVVVAPSVPVGARSGTNFNHYSLLRTAEEQLGLPSTLGAAATAASMRSAFHF